MSAASTPTTTVDERAVKEIAANEYFAFLGADKIRRVAEACERVESAQLRNGGRWLNPATRVEILKILAPDLPQISETYAWMVARRYRDTKRFYIEQERVAELKKKEDEAKAKLAAEKAAKAAKAKAAAPASAAPAAPPAASAASPAAAPGPTTVAAAGPAPSVPPPPGEKSAEAAAVNAGKAPDADGTLTSPPKDVQDKLAKDGPKPG
jgi:hypothetical protein